MKCPKCSLVTFDYLSKCPRCDTSFELSRRLTRRRADPKRRILIASESPSAVAAVAVDSEGTRPHDSALAAGSALDQAGPVEAPRAPAIAPAVAAAAAVSEVSEPARAIPASDAPPEPSAEPPTKAPSLSEMAATERREDLAVNVAAAVAAAREAVRTPLEQPVPAIAPASPAPEPTSDGPEPGESRKIKERMMQASRARRKERPDLVTESTEPVLPDWYEPDLDEPDGAPRSKGDPADRR